MINEQFLRTNATKSTSLLWLEWTLFFVAVPFFLRIWWQPRIVFALLFIATAATAVWLFCRRRYDCRMFWRTNARSEMRQLKKILIRFAVCGTMIAGFVLFVYPTDFLDMPRENPLIWAMVMILYPLLSVYPQEIIYRAFFFERYRRLFPNTWSAVIANAAAFGLIHIIFQNPLAVVLTIVGGVFFAETYARTRSLRLVWFEHALYGCLIFTIGLGQFFYHARVPVQ